ncbi:MAG: CHAT domain-containing protein [bacterium]|nr:CHAT domain-containing protein [bacterium]
MRKASPTLTALLLAILPASAGVSESLEGPAATPRFDRSHRASAGPAPRRPKPGPLHLMVAATGDHLATRMARRGRHRAAHRLFVEAAAGHAEYREQVLSLLGESRKLAFVQKQEAQLHRFLRHTAGFMTRDPAAVRESFDAWLAWKGAGLDAQRRHSDAVAWSADPEIQGVWEELRRVRRELAGRWLAGPGERGREELDHQIEMLARRRETLELRLSGLSWELVLPGRVRRVDAVAQLLPADSAYVDYARIDDFDFTAGRSGGARYLMFVLAPGAAEPLRLIDLGAAEPIDAAVGEYLARIRDQAPPGTLTKSAQSLYEQLLAPAGDILRSRRHLLISPDGPLHRLPFGSLRTPNGDYLVKTLLMTYLASGRDLLGWLRPLTGSREAVVFADPDYDLDRTQGQGDVGETAIGAKSVRGGGGRNPGELGLFKRLPGAREEGAAVSRILGRELGANVATYTADRALEEVLLSIRAPRVLHLATHGFFLADPPSAGSPEPGGVGNPLLRSGIALAGANTSIAEGGHEGLVSAAKIVGLDVRGTELVVLSACSTARGDVRRGEGVFGLPRAFMAAGARTLLITRWQVEDEVIKEVMTEFYTGWAAGLSKAEALRQAQLKLLERYPHPYHWAATFLVGDGR